MADTYTSTVLAPAQIALGVVSGLVAVAILLALNSALWPFALIVFVLIIAAGWYLSPVTLTVEGRRLTIAQGRGDRDPRLIDATEIETIDTVNLTWPQCFGVGLPSAEASTRLSVRAGPTLCLELHDGEVIRISTPDPDAAAAALATTGPGQTSSQR